MIFSLAFNEDYVRLTVSGKFDAAAIVRHLEALPSQPGFHSELGFLWDLRGLDSEGVDRGPMMRITDAAKRIVSAERPGRVAFLVSDALSYGMSRIASAFASTEKRLAEVFLDEASAIEFILHESGDRAGNA